MNKLKEIKLKWELSHNQLFECLKYIGFDISKGTLYTYLSKKENPRIRDIAEILNLSLEFYNLQIQVFLTGMKIVDHVFMGVNSIKFNAMALISNGLYQEFIANSRDNKSAGYIASLFIQNKELLK